MHGIETIDKNQNLNQEYALAYRGNDIAHTVNCHLLVTLNARTISKKDFSFKNLISGEKIELKNTVDLSKINGFNFDTPNHQTKIIIKWVGPDNKENTEEIEVIKD